MINLEDEIQNARRRFEFLQATAGQASSTSSPDLYEALEELSGSLEELQTLQEELNRSNEELSIAWARTKAEQQRYQELFDFAPDAYLITDRHGTIRDVNRTAATLLNVTREHLIGKPLATFIPVEKHRSYYHVLSEILRKGRMKDWQLELLPRKMPPAHVTAAVTVKNLEQGELEFRWALRDMTAARALDRELREREEKYRSLFENSLIGICRSTPDGRFTAINPALAEMLGYESPEEILRLTGAKEVFMDPSERDRLLQEVEGMRGGALRIREVLLKKKTGRPLIATVSMKAIKDSSGKTVAYESQVQDLSDLKDLEERLRHRERLAAVGATAAVLVHEISNPLTGMCTTVEMMERYLANHGQRDETLSSLVDGLKTETRRLSVLVHDFRLLAQSQYTFEPVEIAEIVTEMCKIQGAFNGIKVEVDVPESLPPARADKNKLKQALLNLWKNALEAMPSGGTLIIKGQTLADRLVIEFHDTGTGIPAGIDIFEPFTTTKKDGTGLGLAVVRQIALAHGGAVTYTSQAGKGTIFRLSLPVHFNL